MITLDYAKYRCALFDFDGVVVDTEPQYTVFWASECRRYHPAAVGEEHRLKGMSLTQIYDTFFAAERAEQPAITARLNDYEARMSMPYIPGVEAYLALLRRAGVRTAVVTSSNQRKMQAAYRLHPELRTLFDRVLTAEDFAESKPSPDCYIKGMAAFGASPDATIVFEDSINGLKAARASGATVIGLDTTNPRDVVSQLAHYTISDYN